MGDKWSASKLLGAAPGYVGYEEGGILTEPLIRRPYSVVLLDEVEKAAPEVLTVLLQILMMVELPLLKVSLLTARMPFS